jgi:hypothetical protein
MKINIITKLRIIMLIYRILIRIIKKNLYILKQIKNKLY